MPDKRINVWINDKTAGKTLKSITVEAKKLRTAIAVDLVRGTKDYEIAVKKLNGLNKVIKKHTSDIRGVGTAWRRIKTQVGGFFKSQIGIMASFTGALLFIKRGFQEALKAAIGFEKSMANVFTLLSSRQFQEFGEDLESGSIQIIRKYGFAIEDVNKALFDTISAGVEAGESIEFLNKASKLAVGGVTSLTIATDGLTTILNAFKLETNEAGNVADAFFTAQKFGKTTVEELSAGIGKAAPIAAQLKISYQELLSATAALTKGGIKTDEAITFLRGAMSSLIKPTDEATALFKKEFNVGLGVSAVASRGFGKVLSELSILMQKYPDEIAAAIPNIRGLTAITALSGKGLEEYDKILQAVQTDTGKNSSLTRAFALQQETAAQKIERAKGELSILAKELGEKFLPIILKVISGLGRFIKLIVKTKDVQDRQQQSMRNVVKEFNNEIAILKKANFSTEQRSKFIQELNVKYADYLPNLIDEEASLKEIEKIQKNLNDQLLTKALFLDFEDELKEIYDNQRDALAGVFEIEKQQAKLRFSTQDDFMSGMEDRLGVLESIKNINQIIIDQTDEQVKETEEKFTFLAEKLGKNFDELRKKFARITDDPDPDPKVDPLLDDKEQEARIKKAFKKRTDLIDQQAQLQRIQLKESLNNQAIDQEEFAAQTLTIEQMRLKALLKAFEDFKKDSGNIQEKIIDNEIAEGKRASNAEKIRLQNELDLKKSLISKEIAILEEGSIERFDKLEELAQLELDFQLKQTKVSQEQINALKETFALDWAKRREEITKESDEEEFDRRVENIRLAADTIAGFASIQSSLSSNRIKEIEKQRDVEIEASDDEIKALNDKLENEIISREEFLEKSKILIERANEIEEEAREDIRKEQLKNAKVDKALALFQIAVGTAIGIAKALAKENIPEAIAIGAIGATSALALAIKEIPQAAEGGFTEVIGKDDMKHYRAKISNGFRGGHVKEPTLLVGERGNEFVINNESLKNPIIARTAEAIDHIQQTRQMQTGGFNPSSGNIESETDINQGLSPEGIDIIAQNLQVMKTVISELKNIKATIIWTNDDTENIREEISDQENVEDNSRV